MQQNRILNSAMVAENHFKNGIMSKSMRRFAIAFTAKKNIFIGSMAFCIIMSACSSPESDGIKAAKMSYNYRKELYQKRNEIIKEQNKAYESYIQKFDSYSFKTRIEAREKLNECLEKSKESFQKFETEARELENKAYEYRNKLRSKYETNREKEGKFSYAYNNYKPKERDSKPIQENIYIDYQGQIKTLIQSIIPLKPDLTQLKNDLVGKSIIGNPLNEYMVAHSSNSDYYNRDFRVSITSLDNLKTVEILNVTDNSTNSGKEYVLNVHLILQKEFNQFDANVNVKYELKHNEDNWEFASIETKLMDIVRTDKYNNCIKSQYITKGGFGIPSRHIEFTNSCDIDLVVMGKVSSYEMGRKFNIKVPANGKAVLDNYTINSNQVLYVTDFVIHFIERAPL